MRVDEAAGFLMVWETVPRNYFFISFLFSCNLSLLFAISNCTDGFMRLSNKEMKLETNFTATVTKLRSVALKWCMTSPSYIKGHFVYSQRNSWVDLV
jgi:hypothetical protein